VERRGPSAYIAELLGTMVLVFAIGMAVSLHQPTTVALGYQDFAVIGFVHVFALAMLVHSFGGTSGGHFNPAVTAVMASVRKIAPVDAAIYFLMQLVGGVLGALLVHSLLRVQGGAANYGAPGFENHFLGGNAGTAFIAEAIGTFLLVWAIFGAAVNPRSDASWAPWIIGGTLGLAVMIIGPLTGGSFNPARAFGPALVGNAFDPTVLKWLFVYVLGPVVGALIAGWSYMLIALRPRDMDPGTRPIDKLES
jgi:glycerol uptake facilitator protein